jgi:hypothetical protein
MPISVDGGPITAVRSADLVFHVIYTPDTVALLAPMLVSLLRWSDCRYRVIANGCRPGEVALLHRLAADEPRVEVVEYATKLVRHEHILTDLFRRSTEPYFCIVDSDVFATGPFLEPFLPHLPENAALFSAWPVSVTAADQVQPAHARFNLGRHRTDVQGQALGGTYLAIHARRAVEAALPLWPGGFDRGYGSKLPRKTKRWLAEMGQHATYYDTGRILCQAMRRQGARLTYVSNPHLGHIGAVSIQKSILDRPHPTLTTFWSDPIGQSRRLAGNLIFTLVHHLRLGDRASFRHDPAHQAYNRRKHAVEVYCTAYIRALILAPPVPDRPPLDAETDAKLIVMVEAISEIYRSADVAELRSALRTALAPSSVSGQEAAIHA